MQAKVKVGSTVGGALSFTLSNFGAVLRVGWFPLFVGIALTVALYAYFLGPAWAELWELARTAAEGGAQKGPPPIPEEDPLVHALMQMNLQQASAFYSASILISLLIYTIPSAAYARMVAGVGTPRGPFYFRIGGRELSLVVDYLAIGIVMYVGVLLIVFATLIPVLVGAAVSSSANGGEPNASVFIFMLIILVPGIFLGLLLPLAKLGLAIPIASIEGGLGLGESWDMTRGNVWRIFWALVLGALLMIAFYMVAVIVLVILAIPPILIATAFGESAAILTGIVVAVVLYTGFYFVSYCFSIAFGTAILTKAYTTIKGASSEVPAQQGET